jgi:transposase
MMTKIRKKYGKEFKLKVVSEILGGVKTLAQLSSEHGVHATQIKEWKTQALEPISKP